MLTVAILAAAILLTAVANRWRQSGTRSRLATAAPTSSALATVDDYLRQWDRFAQGQSQLAPDLRGHEAEFERSLSLALANDPAAVSRMIFYPVVQVGGSIPADSELGVAALEVLGPTFPVTTTEKGERTLFARDLYLWWEKHQDGYPHFSTFDDWVKRDFARNTVLPMYRSVAEQPRS